MSSSEEQARQVADGLKHDAKMPPPLTIEQWRAKLAPFHGRNRMALNDVIVGELLQLVDRCAAAEEKLARCERWAMKNVAGDGLRRVLYPSKYPAPPDETCLFCDRPVQPYVTCVCETG